MMLLKILGEKKAVWIPAAALLALNFLVFAGYRYVFAEKYSLETVKKEKLEKDRESLCATHVGLKKTLEDWQRALDGIEAVYTLTGTREEKFTALIQDVDGLARKAGVVPHQIAFGYSDMPKGGLTEARITFPFEADYRSVRNLLHLLEVTPSFIITESVSLAASGELQDKIRLQFALRTYFKKEERP